jgi:hypothetical protein
LLQHQRPIRSDQSEQEQLTSGQRAVNSMRAVVDTPATTAAISNHHLYIGFDSYQYYCKLVSASARHSTVINIQSAVLCNAMYKVVYLLSIVCMRASIVSSCITVTSRLKTVSLLIDLHSNLFNVAISLAQ